MRNEGKSTVGLPANSLTRSFDLLSRRTVEVQEARRAEVVRALSQTQELAAIASKLGHGDTYRVVLSQPVRGGLHTRADGMLDAFVKGKDGKVIAVARLQKAGSALVSAAAALAGEAMLVQISAQIERLQGAIEQVLAKIEADRLGKVDSALAFLALAHHYRPEHHTPLLQSAEQTLRDVLAGALRDTRQGIAAVPEPQKWNLTRAVWDTTGLTEKALDRAAASMWVVLLCLKALAQVQFHLNGEEGSANIMGHWLRQALDLPLRQVESSLGGFQWSQRRIGGIGSGSMHNRCLHVGLRR